MKVIHLISGSEGGGSRFQVLSLLEELVQNTDDDHDIELVSLMEGPLTQDARERGLPIKVIPMKGMLDFRVISPLIRYLAERKPDILHTHGVRANFIGRLTYKFMLSDLKPVMFTTVHSSIYHDYTNSWKRFIYPFMEKSLRAVVHRFIAVSDGLYQELLQDGIEEDRLALVPNGIYTEKFSPDTNSDSDPTTLKEELGIPEEATVILTVGRLVPVKGQDYLLEAFKDLLEDLTEEEDIGTYSQEKLPYLVIVGDGPLGDSLSSKAKSLGIEEKVIFTGFRRDIPAFFQMADIFTLPSLMEGMPIILLEAMAARLPLVASRVGGVSEVVNEGETGLMVPSKDPKTLAEALKRLWQSPDLCRKLGGQAGERVERDHHFSRVVTETLKLYQKTVNSKREPG
ncbi:glycosyltransferase [Natranaerobius thermophilus]|uniref:Glycosyl transferase group 1 n=1 Tax=Natranaerobius thermophilus (strain ATCC BAA-1301 / DSM 18059 / JW/NM-WN-LF) TaxID=457570 RepID=B2A0R8_NATTJ|nr:glycosyltransferase [Natranaerobius thermophilus]ACB85948.1 glycosyl transferase group 1 [Natranaerobius thermophilus JW/NM-WN-LF]